MKFEEQCLKNCFKIWNSAKTIPSVEALLAELWKAMADSLLEQKDLTEQICRLQRMQALLLCMLFPEDMKTHNQNWKVSLLLASLMTLQALLQLRRHAQQPWVQHIAHIAVNPIRQIILARHVSAQQVEAAICFLQHALEGMSFPDEACVYCLFNCSAWYVGKRFYEEHLSSILRRNRPAPRTVRAVLLRQRPAHSICFILVKRGAHNWMKVSETVAIRTLRPPGYMGKKNSGLLGTSARRRQQSKHGSLGLLSISAWGTTGCMGLCHAFCFGQQATYKLQAACTGRTTACWTSGNGSWLCEAKQWFTDMWIDF